MSERVRERLSGAQIDRQFDSISQGGYIRTTPTPSSRSSTSLGSYDRELTSTSSAKGAVSSSPNSPKAGPVQRGDESEDTSVTPTTQSPCKTCPEDTTKPKENRPATTARPPPILKKLSSGSDQSSKSSSILSPASRGLWSTVGAGSEEAVSFDDDATPTELPVPIAGKSARRSITTRFNEEVAVSIPKVSTVSRSSGGRLSGETSQRAGRRNPIVVGSSAANKRRAPVIRQKSPQVTPIGASKDASSRTSSSPNVARSMKPTFTTTARSPGQEAEALSAVHSHASSPHPSMRRQGSSPGPPSSSSRMEDFGSERAGAQKSSAKPIAGPILTEETADANSEIAKPLVDPDFRSKFVDKTRPSNRSVTNISSFAHKSSAAMPTAASFQALGTLDTGQSSPTAGKNKGKKAFKNEVVPLKAPASAGPEPPAEASQPLPRTKSQLTLLLEREKNRPAGQEH